MAAYNPTDLVALSSVPLLVYPTHYTGEEGYMTDTEDSTVIGSEELSVEEDLRNINTMGDMGDSRDEL